MLQLAVDLESSAYLFGTEPHIFLEFVEREHVAGVIKLNGEWRISIFTLAQLLNTTPETLLELFEDYALGQLLEEVADEEWFEGHEAEQLYQHYLAETQK